MSGELLTWSQLWALKELRDAGDWVIREESRYRPNTLDSLVRRGLAEATWSRGGHYATSYRITRLGLSVDLSDLDGIG